MRVGRLHPITRLNHLPPPINLTMPAASMQQEFNPFAERFFN
jgi:hypothetical protein